MIHFSMYSQVISIMLRGAVCYLCRWAVGAVVLMKRAWAADDANVGNVRPQNPNQIILQLSLKEL